MKGLRPLLGLLLLGLAGWALAVVFQPPETEATPRTFTSSMQCKECHPEVFDEWERSQHREAWNNPAVRMLSDNFENKDCRDCHAPRPVFLTGIGNRVLPRSTREPEGVDCISCHMLPDGRIAGTIDKPSAPCRPVATVELQREDFCAGCHDQHKTVQQWLASDYAAQGIGCLDCHMPFRNDDPNAGRSHLFLGGHDIETVRSAVELTGARVGDKWQVSVKNSGAGHHYPTDERSRASDVFWRPLVAEGEEPGPWRHLYRFRDPYRYEVDLPATHLPAGETWTGEIEDEDAAGGVEVGLFYKLSPYYQDPENPDPEGEARLVHRVELRP